MSPTLTQESRLIAVEIHRALSEIDPVRWRAEAAGRLREKLQDVQIRLRAIAEEKWPDETSDVRARFVEMAKSLATQLPTEEGTLPNARVRWLAFRRAMLPAYESLQLSLKDLQIHVPTLRPTNVRRSVLHALGGMSAIAILYFTMGTSGAIWVAGPLAFAGWTMEISRRRSPRINDILMRALGGFAHPHERRRVNSATWYCSALLILALTFDPLASAIGLAALGLGDPAASTIGRRYGRRRLLHGRTLEGTLAFVVVVLLGGTLVAGIFAPELALSTWVVLAAVGAVSGAVAEAVSLRIDDNFSVPLFSAGLVTVVGTILGVL